jgi:hypothetical protein
MKVECIVSCVITVDVATPVMPITSDAIIEALAKNEFFCKLPKMTPDDLSVEILEMETM